VIEMGGRRHGWDRWRSLAIRGLACLLLGVVEAGAAGVSPTDPVQVFYPRGACETGILEIELWNRVASEWGPHPAHWRVLADTCQEEDAGDLLNEIRVRCVDLANPARASKWRVGVEVYHPGEAPSCIPPQKNARRETDPDIELAAPSADAPVRTISKVVNVSGRVLLHREVVLLLDDSFERAEREATASALLDWLRASAPHLGTLRVGLIRYRPRANTEAAGRRASAANVPLLDRPSDVEARLSAWANGGRSGRGAVTGFVEGAESAAAALEAHGRAGAPRTLVAVVNGQAALPFGRTSASDPRYRRRVLGALGQIVGQGTTLQVLVVGRREVELAELTDLARKEVRGIDEGAGVFVIEDAGRARAALATIDVTTLRELRLVNLANGVLAEPLESTAGGDFTGSVRMETGGNLLRARAVLSDGRVLTADFEREFDATALREHALAQERERMRSVREREGVVTVDTEDK
jgi:hypothetical protein